MHAPSPTALEAARPPTGTDEDPIPIGTLPGDPRLAPLLARLSQDSLLAAPP